VLFVDVPQFVIVHNHALAVVWFTLLTPPTSHQLTRKRCQCAPAITRTRSLRFTARHMLGRKNNCECSAAGHNYRWSSPRYSFLSLLPDTTIGSLDEKSTQLTEPCNSTARTQRQVHM